VRKKEKSRKEKKRDKKTNSNKLLIQEKRGWRKICINIEAKAIEYRNVAERNEILYDRGLENAHQ
jgi:hypothetical protein